MRVLLPGLLVALAVGSAAPLAPQPPPDTLEVYAVRGSEAELAVVEQLLAARVGHDFRDWEVVPVVRIDETQTPHSHPVPTLHTRHRGDADALLAVHLHEQFHWWVLERSDALDRARTDLRAAYPNAPIERPLGAGSERSTYLHLVVCHLEYQAMRLLVGDERARRTLAANSHYTWIYERVLDDPTVADILARHGLQLS